MDAAVTEQVKLQDTSNESKASKAPVSPQTSEASEAHKSEHKAEVKPSSEVSEVTPVTRLNPHGFPQNTPKTDLSRLMLELKQSRATSMHYQMCIPYLREIPEITIDTNLTKFTLAFAKSDMDDFAWTATFYPPLIAAMMYHGWLPTAYQITDRSGKQAFCWGFPKLHTERCVLKWPDFVIHKQIKKKANKYLITVDRAFKQVVKAVKDQHDKCWIYPPLEKAFIDLHETNDQRATSHVHSVEVWAHKSMLTEEKGEHGSAASDSTDKKEKVDIAKLVEEIDAGKREIDWNDWVLVAGDLGYTVGTIYVSLSGFSNRAYSSAGSVQLAALGGLLQHCGIELWDLGMTMKYKEDLGGRTIPRLELVEVYKQNRDKFVNLAPGQTPKDIADAPKFVGSSVRLQCKDPISTKRAIGMAVVHKSHAASGGDDKKTE